MQYLGIATIAAGQSNVPLNAGNAFSGSVLVLYNESNNVIVVQWGSHTKPLPAWTGDRFDLAGDANGFSGQVMLSAVNISSASNAPSSEVIAFVYGAGEPITGVYPCALVRMTNVGNGSLPVTSAQAVINDGNAAGTTVVEATQSGQASSSLKFLNDGTALLAPVSHGALLDCLVVTPGTATSYATGSFGDSANPNNWNLYGNLAPANITSGALPSGVTVAPANLTGSGAVPTGWTMPANQITSGNLNIGTGKLSSDNGKLVSDGSGNLTAAGTITSNNQVNVLYLGSATSLTMFDADFSHVSGGHRFGWNAYNNGTQAFYDYTGGGYALALNSNGIQPGAQGDTIGGYGYFSGSGSGTYSHNCGSTPNTVQVTCNKLNSSQTMGVDSAGATTVHVTCGAGYPFYGVAFA